jgi:hypothetical protein
MKAPNPHPLDLSSQTPQAYSHGLEKIYEFETISPSTVRRFSSSPLSDATHLPDELSPNKKLQDLEFDFGPTFTETLPDFRLDEPIESLQLSPFAYKAATGKGLKRVEEAAKIVLLPKKENIGLGLGHLDEIKAKVLAFLGPLPFEKKGTVHFDSLVRLLLSSVDTKDRAFFLNYFHLASIFPLKPAELSELEKWTPEMKHKSYERTLHSLKTNFRGHLIKKFTEITHAFLIPWLHIRQGISCQAELEERLFMLAANKNSQQTKYILQLFEAILDTKNLFSLTLFPIAPTFYASSQAVCHRAEHVQNQAKSYFYTPDICYPFDTLATFLLRDFTQVWAEISREFIEKVIKNSPSFTLRKEITGTPNGIKHASLWVHLDSKPPFSV